MHKVIAQHLDAAQSMREMIEAENSIQRAPLLKEDSDLLMRTMILRDRRRRAHIDHSYVQRSDEILAKEAQRLEPRTSEVSPENLRTPLLRNPDAELQQIKSSHDRLWKSRMKESPNQFIARMNQYRGGISLPRPNKQHVWRNTHAVLGRMDAYHRPDLLLPANIRMDHDIPVWYGAPDGRGGRQPFYYPASK